MNQPNDLTPKEAQLAADFHADVGVEHIAAVYAKALLGATEAAGQSEAILAEYDALVTEVLDRFPQLEELLRSLLVPQEEKESLLDRLLAQQASPLLLSFLKVLSRHGRLELLRPVHREARQLYDAKQGRIRVELVTASAVDAALMDRVCAALRQILGGEPVVEHRLQPDLIGGAVVRVGDTVYDGSVAKQLDNLRQQIIDRSVHEIQSRRDRFRHPAGN